MNKHAILLATVTLTASSFAIAGGPPDTVVGAARFDSVGSKVEIMAKSDADGTNATGRFRLRQGDFDIQGEITCLSVSGNWSSAGGTIVKSDDISLLGEGFIQLTRDNGEGWDDSDQSQTAIGVDPADCALYTNFEPAFDVNKGNYEIKDR